MLSIIRAPIASSSLMKPMRIRLSISPLAPATVRFTSPVGFGIPSKLVMSVLSKTKSPVPVIFAPAASTVRLFSVSALSSPGTTSPASTRAISASSNRLTKGVTLPVRSMAMVAGSRGRTLPGSNRFQIMSAVVKPASVTPRATSSGVSDFASGRTVAKASSSVDALSGNGRSPPAAFQVTPVARVSSAISAPENRAERSSPPLDAAPLVVLPSSVKENCTSPPSWRKELVPSRLDAMIAAGSVSAMPVGRTMSLAPETPDMRPVTLPLPLPSGARPAMS